MILERSQRRLITPERVAYARSHAGREAETQLTEVIGQRKLLKWSVPGAAHAVGFWASSFFC